MTIPNRTVSITGIFAADASTTIPLNPVPGASYRDTTMTGTVVREGWAFKTIVDSSKFNQAMYEYSSVTAQIEKYGFLPWSNLTDYVLGSVCLGSNGNLYQANQATGPSTTAVDPTTDSTVWQQIILGNTNSLFDHKWEDYILNRMDWLRADTFSWQDGTVYSDAYNHLVADYNGGTSQTETVGSYTITYVLATDGHKITTDETNVANIYNESGVAWYYVLDTSNQRFKLPRENPSKEVLAQSAPVIGNGTTLGLTDGTNTAGTFFATGATLGNRNDLYGTPVGSTSASGTGTASLKSISVTTDPTKSGVVTDLSETTGVYKGNKYLYFYVGQFSQSATEQTAGLNSSLFNGKVDLDGSNATFPHIVETYQSGTNWYRIYSDGWCEQGGESTINTVTLLQAYKDTNYNVQISFRGSNNNNPYFSAISVNTKTTTSFTYGYDTSVTRVWEAKGFIS